MLLLTKQFDALMKRRANLEQQRASLDERLKKVVLQIQVIDAELEAFRKAVLPGSLPEKEEAKSA